MWYNWFRMKIKEIVYTIIYNWAYSAKQFKICENVIDIVYYDINSSMLIYFYFYLFNN